MRPCPESASASLFAAPGCISSPPARRACGGQDEHAESNDATRDSPAGADHAALTAPAPRFTVSLSQKGTGQMHSSAERRAAAGTNASIEIVPLTLHIGAEIRGVDLTQPLPPEQLKDVR